MARYTLLLLTLLAALVATSAAQEDMFKYVNQIPKCGMTCILQEVPKSPCRTVTNTTCLCTDEALREATQACVMRTCESILDALEAAKVEAEACQRPYRDSRQKLFASIPVQAITFVTICLRMYSRWETSKAFEADDWIVIVCLVFYVPFCVLGTITGQLAFGRDIWTVPPANLTLALKNFYVAQTFYVLCLGLTKIALLLFFLRIFPSKPFRRATHIIIAFTALSTAILVLVQIFQCLPVRYNWEGWQGPPASGGRCVNVNALAFAAAGLSIVQDIVILVLPMPPLLRLQVSPRTKAGIVFMFSLGVFILVTSCIRLRYIIIFARSANPTWDYVDAFIWSGTEISVSMIVVSLPAIRLLLTRVVPGVFSTIASKTGWSFGGSQNTNTGQSQGPHRHQQQESRGGEDSKVEPGDMEMEDSQHTQKQREVDVEKAQQHRQSLPRLRPLSKFNTRSLYTFGAGKRAGSNESEETLELGDRTRDGMQTTVTAGSDGSSTRGRNGSEDGDDSKSESRIRVRTTTTATTNTTAAAAATQASPRDDVRWTV